MEKNKLQGSTEIKILKRRVGMDKLISIAQK